MSGNGGGGTPTPSPSFFVTAHSKGVMDVKSVTAHSAQFKVMCFEKDATGFVSVLSNGLTKAKSVTAHSKRLAAFSVEDLAKTFKIIALGTLC
jgi:hypothetical protein